MSRLQRSNLLVSRCFVKIKDFIKPENVSEELPTHLLKPYLNH